MDTQPCKVLKPEYEKDAIQPGIVHFGPGNFFRGHLAVIIDRYMDHTGDHRWGITGVTLHDPEKAEKLARQGFNYHVAERDSDTCVIREIRSLKNILHAPSDRQAVIDLIASPETKLVTMTITQKGYVTPEGGFEPGDPQTVADYLVHALQKRRMREQAQAEQDAAQSGTTDVFNAAATSESQPTLKNLFADAAAPSPMIGGVAVNKKAGLTLMSCDNIPDNGTELKKAVLARAAYFAGLPEWIEEKVSFPDTMVDRIVPATREEDVLWLKERFGIDDSLAIFTEPFRQLVIQRRFSGEFPNLEYKGDDAKNRGILILDKMSDYELMKIRMLNGTHFALGLAGTLAGYTYIDEALKDPDIREFAQSFMREAANSLRPIEGVDYDDYRERNFKRFVNPHMKDELVRLARNGSDKLRPRCLAIVRDLRDKGMPYRHMALVAAAWSHYIKGINGKGEQFDILDDKAAKQDWPHLARKLSDIARDQRTGGQILAEMQSIFEDDLARDPAFHHAFGYYHSLIGRHGVQYAMREVDNPVVQMFPAGQHHRFKIA